MVDTRHTSRRTRAGTTPWMSLPDRRPAPKRRVPAPARRTPTPAANNGSVADRLASLFFKAGKGGRKIDGKKPKKYQYSGLMTSTTESGRVKKWHSRRYKIHQGQFKKVGMGNERAPASSGNTQRRIPSGFTKFTAKRNALLAKLAQRAGVPEPMTYKSFMRTSKNVNLSRPENLGLPWFVR